MPLLTETIGAILNNYADAVEGGNAYNGGTVYRGIPSVRSFDRRLWTGVVGSGDTTQWGVSIATISVEEGQKLLRSDAPPYFLLYTAGPREANIGAARKIINVEFVNAGEGGVLTVFTVETAFAAITAVGTMSVLEGFKYLPDIYDIESDEADVPGGWDRRFSLDLVPGSQMDWGGDGTEQWRSTMQLRLRILKKGRERTARMSALENIQNIASILTGITAQRGPVGQDMRGAYTQNLSMMDTAPTIEQDENKVVATINFRIIYRFDAVYR